MEVTIVLLCFFVCLSVCFFVPLLIETKTIKLSINASGQRRSRPVWIET